MSSPTSRRTSPAPRIIFWTLLALAAVLGAIAVWIRYRFGSITFEQVLSTLPVAGGEGVGNEGYAVEFATWCVGIPLGTVAVAALVARRRRRPVRRAALLAPGTAAAIALGTLLIVAGVPQYAAASLDSRTVAEYYVPPRVETRPEQPRNLITIYLESTENTYADAGRFGANLIAAHQQATAGWAGYDLRQDPVGGWTMAGLVGSQCGIPLKSQLVAGDPSSFTAGESVEHFLPGAICLGDVLRAEGYTNAFLGGAHLRFAGKGTFLTDHGFTRLRGREEWELTEDESVMSPWGLSDARLFEHAEQTLAELRAEGGPFHLSLLTLDTHEPGAVFPSCEDASAPSPIAAALKCSGAALAGFLDHLDQAGYLDDTVVVVMGDHLKNLSDSDQLRDQLTGAEERTIFFRVHSPDPVSFARPGADQLSVLPTVLELLGFGLPEGRAGLGVSFAAHHGLHRTLAALPKPAYASLLQAPSRDLYHRFWTG